MWHSVKFIGEEYEKISKIREKDKFLFTSNDFFIFAKNNIKKYNLIEIENNLLVSTFYSDILINDFKLTLIK